MGSEIMAVGVDSRKRRPWFTSFEIEKIGVWCVVCGDGRCIYRYITLLVCRLVLSRNVQEKSRMIR